MKKIILALMAVILSVTAANAFIDSYTIDRDKLPDPAKEMLDEYFPKAKISMIKVDRHLLKKTDYDVKLTNGTKIEFSNKGKWSFVDCGKKALPDGLVPNTIVKYIQKNFAGVTTVSIRIRNAGYDIGFDDGTEHRFNLLGMYRGLRNGGDDEDEE